MSTIFVVRKIRADEQEDVWSEPGPQRRNKVIDPTEEKSRRDGPARNFKWRTSVVLPASQ